jgi:histone H2A
VVEKKDTMSKTSEDKRHHHHDHEEKKPEPRSRPPLPDEKNRKEGVQKHPDSTHIRKASTKVTQDTENERTRKAPREEEHAVKREGEKHDRAAASPKKSTTAARVADFPTATPPAQHTSHTQRQQPEHSATQEISEGAPHAKRVDEEKVEENPSTEKTWEQEKTVKGKKEKRGGPSEAAGDEIKGGTEDAGDTSTDSDIGDIMTPEGDCVEEKGGGPVETLGEGPGEPEKDVGAADVENKKPKVTRPVKQKKKQPPRPDRPSSGPAKKGVQPADILRPGLGQLVRQKVGHVRAEKRAGIVFPVSRAKREITTSNYKYAVGKAASVYMAAAVQYVAAEIMDIADGQCKKQGKKIITQRHILLAVRDDAELDILVDADISKGGVMPFIHKKLRTVPKKKIKKRKRSGSAEPGPKPHKTQKKQKK